MAQLMGISHDNLELIVAVLASLLASSGFWAYFAKQTEKKDLTRRMLIGLAHDRVMELGGIYIGRGWISQDEYENLCVYLYTPYKEIGGNGSAKRVMDEVDRLPIRNERVYTMEVVKNGSQQ